MSENQRVSVDRMADVIMEGLTEYAELAADVMKDCVTVSYTHLTLPTIYSV